MNDFRPVTLSKTPGLEITPMPDGYVVHDPVLDRIHYLNPTSALIFELCDGATSIEQIAAIVMDSFDLPEAPVEETRVCVEKLTAEGLVFV